MKYLFKQWDRLKKELSNKYIILFLDYDGTLTPIVESPDKAVIPEETRELLEELSNIPNCKLAIISGRSLKDIKNRVGLRRITYVGNHGLEIEGPKIKFESQISPRYTAIFRQIRDNLSRKLFNIKGVFVEDKGLTLAIHYRKTNKANIPLIKTIFHEAVIFYLIRNKIKVKSGKMVLEVRPPVDWDKGKVVMWLLARQKFIIKDRTTIPIYIGDDITDEDAFKVLRNKGLTIFVGKPRASHAQYYLKNTQEVIEFMRRLLQLFIT